MTPWPTALATLVVGLLAGWVATRNARKTPHENLKALTEIRAALADDDETATMVLNEAIKYEIDRLARLSAARRRGSLAYAREVLRQRPVTVAVVVSLAITLPFSFLVTWAVVAAGAADSAEGLGDYANLAALFAALAAFPIGCVTYVVVDSRSRRAD
ncbi:hypothetical protein [Gordonia jacobaea]|uniref:hypothetical protein n=1 Tax=Gordonia jacobaea TaxID=122202 RepID=UPI003D71DE73